MDIYQQADAMDADYYDMETGNIFLIQEYNRARRFGLPTPGIRVISPDGEFIGYARRRRMNDGDE